MYFLIIATVMATFSMKVEAQKTSNGKKVLVAYFSRSGNPKAIANHIKELTGGDLFEIQTAKPHPADYHACTEAAKKEKNDNARPELKEKVKNMEEYDTLAKEMIKREKEGKGFNFFHFMIDLTGGPCVYKRLSGCGSGTEYLAVTPWGDFYPCHQFVGEEQYLMGNVDEGITKPEIQKEFGGCNVYTKKDCKDCFARFYCSGGCAANAFHFQGDIKGNYEIGCELQRKRVECAIMIKAALACD